MDFTNASVICWLGPNLEKGARNYKGEVKRAKKEFRKKYPFARIEQFDFWPSINSDGELTQPAEVRYVGDGNTLLPNITGTTKSYSWPVTSNTFKYRYSSALYFGPTVIWNPGGEMQPFKKTNTTLPFNPRRFKAFVSENQSFVTNFPQIHTNWANKDNNDNILEADFDTLDPYFNSVASAYILSTLSGVCKDHFKESKKVPKQITSILRYFLYYHRARFSHDPDRLKEWLDEDDMEKIQSLIPTKSVWEQRYVYRSKEIPAYWLRAQPASERQKIKSVGYIAIDKYGGSRGIKYLYRTKVTNKSGEDWMSFIQEKSNGFTRTGQLLLQEAVESYVYAVLGSQARTRFKIVGAGAKSSQTQQIFQTIVKDTVAQDDDSVLISEMRKAISSTNVVLDMTIIPQVVLIPSKMIILEKPIPGYSNVLLTATKEMGFGKNDKINFQGFSHTLTITPNNQEETPSNQEEEFSTSKPNQELSSDEEEDDVTPPHVVRLDAEDKKVEIKKDTHWDDLSSIFYMTLASVLFGTYMIVR